MKITYIANFRIPTMRAHGVQVMKMCEAFAKKGLAVELLIPWRFFSIAEDPFQHHQVQKIFKIKRIFNFDTLQLPLGKIGSWITTLSFLLFVKIHLFFNRCDTLYTRELLAGLFFQNFILEIHHLPAQITPFYKYLLRRAKLIVVITSFLKKELVVSGIPENKILILPDSVDLKEFDLDISKEEARKKLNLPLNKKIIMYSGSFYVYDWKGADVLLEAAKLLPDDYLIVCVGIHNSEEMEQIQKRYAASNILLKYYVPHQSVIWYLKAADALVLPNKAGDKISEFYTSPIKLFEYMAVRRPIISSDLPSLREVLTDQEAVFFEAGNSEDLARAVKSIFQNQELSEKLSYNAYRKVQDYTWDNRVSSLLKTCGIQI